MELQHIAFAYKGNLSLHTVNSKCLHFQQCVTEKAQADVYMEAFPM